MILIQVKNRHLRTVSYRKSAFKPHAHSPALAPGFVKDEGFALAAGRRCCAPSLTKSGARAHAPPWGLRDGVFAGRVDRMRRLSARPPVLAVVAIALVLAAQAAHAAPRGPGPQAGDAYEIVRDREMSGKTGGGSSSSTDRDTLVERVIRVDQEGLELEYDLPRTATAQDRASAWQFPARVFKPRSGPSRLLNGPELEARLGAWLKAGKLDRSDCGRLIFTWNAFRIECDPQSVIGAIEQFDLGPGDLHAGDLYRAPQANAAAPLVRSASGPNGATYVVSAAVDADQVRRARATTDVTVAELQGRKVTPEAALEARWADEVSGTITITLDADATGRLRRRMTVAKVETKRPNGRLETETLTETLERRLVAPHR